MISYCELPVSTRLAMNCLDGGITCEEYSRLEPILVFTESKDILEEGLGRKILDYVIDVIQVAGGVVAVAGTAGFGGDTIVDSIVAVEATTSTLSTINSIMKAGDILSQFVEGVKGLVFSQSFSHIYSSVQKLLTSMSAGVKGFKKVLDSLMGKIKDLIESVIRSAEKYLSTLIPDDAGVIGITIRKGVMAGISIGMGSAYSILTSAVSALAPSVTAMFFDESKVEKFLYNTMAGLITILKKVKAGESFADAAVGKSKEDEGWGKKIGRGALKLTGAAWSVTPIGMIAAVAKNPLLDSAISFIEKTIIPSIPMAAKTFVFIWKILFAGMAALQIIASGDYKEERFTAFGSKKAPISHPEKRNTRKPTPPPFRNIDLKAASEIIAECTSPGGEFLKNNSLLRYYS